MPDPTCLRVDIISDVMCPWCIIGFKQLAHALDTTNTPYEIHWHPFELNPDMPAQGQDGREHLIEKYGVTAEQSDKTRSQMAALGRELGFDFRFADGFRMHNTFNSHQLLHWAQESGRQHDLKMALFAAHFTHRRDLSDKSVLADIAGEIGLDREIALEVLTDQRCAPLVRDAEKFWIKQGVQGVPAVIFNQRHLVTGAQGVDNYTDVLRQIAEMPD